VINSDVFHAAHRTDILAPGGFLVTPKRDLYGGAFVLVPWLNLDRGHKYDQIKTYADFTFNHREVLSLNPPVINIENGTTRSYFAQDTASHLERYSIAVNELVTAEERSDTTKISYVPTPKNQEAVKQILRIMDAEVNYLPITDSDIVNNVITITLGADAVDDSHLIRIPKKESEINLPDLD
jgi:hypothetical protein